MRTDKSVDQAGPPVPLLKPGLGKCRFLPILHPWQVGFL
jgi:hypothetical protein